MVVLAFVHNLGNMGRGGAVRHRIELTLPLTRHTLQQRMHASAW